MKIRWIVLIVVLLLISGIVGYSLIPKKSGYKSDEEPNNEEKQKLKLIQNENNEEIREPKQEAYEEPIQRDPEFVRAHSKTTRFSVDITGKELQKLTVREIAELWKIEETHFLVKINEKYNTNADLDTTIESIFDNIPGEDKPKEIKLIAEGLVV